MTWRIELDKAAERDLDKLDPQIARRILRFLHDRVAALDDPAALEKRLKVPVWVNSGNTARVITGLFQASRMKPRASW